MEALVELQKQLASLTTTKYACSQVQASLLKSDSVKSDKVEVPAKRVVYA